MIDYLINNWIDLGILLVLIIILWGAGRDAYVINNTLSGIHSKLQDINLKQK